MYVFGLILGFCSILNGHLKIGIKRIIHPVSYWRYPVFNLILKNIESKNFKLPFTVPLNSILKLSLHGTTATYQNTPSSRSMHQRRHRSSIRLTERVCFSCVSTTRARSFELGSKCLRPATTSIKLRTPRRNFFFALDCCLGLPLSPPFAPAPTTSPLCTAEGTISMTVTSSCDMALACAPNEEIQ